jgi:hypothetical protein
VADPPQEQGLTLIAARPRQEKRLRMDCQRVADATFL